MDRITQLREMLAARLNGEGKPSKGYRRNVAMIRGEIARLEAEAAAQTTATVTTTESA